MNGFAHQQLLDYLLGTLDDDEQRAVERKLQSDPEWRRELAAIRRRYATLLDVHDELTPPPGLAERTCRYVWQQAQSPQAPPPPVAPARKSMSPVPAPTGWSRRFGWADVFVAVGVLLVAISLIAPALSSGRFQARVNACQDNLRELGTSLTRYSEQHEGFFPRVPREGPTAAAGIYAPTLVQYDLLPDAHRVVCPGSPLADEADFQVPSLAQLQAAPPDRVCQSLPKLGGSYGYSLGYVSDGKYHDTRNLRRDGFALLADAPTGKAGHRQSLNHDGRGENVLFEDGHVAFLPVDSVQQLPDDFFSNDAGLIAAGIHADDSVIVPSDTPPIVSGMQR